VKLTDLLPMIARSISWTFSKSTKTWFTGGGTSGIIGGIKVYRAGLRIWRRVASTRWVAVVWAAEAGQAS
jgi:hypothetical protein